MFSWLVTLSLGLNYSKGETIFRVDFVIVGTHVTNLSLKRCWDFRGKLAKKGAYVRTSWHKGAGEMWTRLLVAVFAKTFSFLVVFISISIHFQ